MSDVTPLAYEVDVEMNLGCARVARDPGFGDLTPLA